MLVMLRAPKETIFSGLSGTTERFQEIASPYIPYLSYRRGDTSELLDSLSATTTNAKQLYEESERWIGAQRDEITQIVQATREAAASAGVATFTEKFETEATTLSDDSKNMAENRCCIGCSYDRCCHCFVFLAFDTSRR